MHNGWSGSAEGQPAGGRLESILLVENNERIARLLSAICENLFREVLTVRSLTECRSIVDQMERLDGALVDVHLPDGSGLDLIKPLRDRFARSRLVVLTAYPSTAGAVHAIREGADEYLGKPILVDDLAHALVGTCLRSPTTESSKRLPTIQQLEWEYINAVLHRVGGNITRAAQMLGIHRQSLQRKLRSAPPRELRQPLRARPGHFVG